MTNLARWWLRGGTPPTKSYDFFDSVIMWDYVTNWKCYIAISTRPMATKTLHICAVMASTATYKSVRTQDHRITGLLDVTRQNENATFSLLFSSFLRLWLTAVVVNSEVWNSQEVMFLFYDLPNTLHLKEWLKTQLYLLTSNNTNNWWVLKWVIATVVTPSVCFTYKATVAKHLRS